MPELPEVEIIKRGLNEKIAGKQIAEVDIHVSKIFQGQEDDVIGAKVSKIKRRAKMIIIGLDNDKSLLIHLKMTGQLVYQVKSEKHAPSPCVPCNNRTQSVSPEAMVTGEKVKSGEGEIKFRGGHPQKGYLGKLPNQFTHVTFKFSDGSLLYFNDLRKFGYIKVYNTKEINDLKVIKELGPEPFAKELTPEYLMKICAKKPRAKIKQILMDQTIISGVGNIYADESLFCAGISPLRLARDAKRSELEKIIGCIKKVLKKGLEYGGSSENTFVNVEGKPGRMQNHFMIYRKTGQKCPNNCGIVRRTVVGGRGTHYCPICQR